MLETSYSYQHLRAVIFPLGINIWDEKEDCSSFEAVAVRGAKRKAQLHDECCPSILGV